jgi:hypothetical protein
VLYLGIPATSVTTPGNSAYLSSTSFTATGGQTTFTPSGSYQVGFINVIRNGSQLAPADYTATNGTTVVLANACVAGDVVVVEVYNLVSIANALPSTGGTVTGATTFNSSVTINGGSASGYTGYKNRIINGGMVIDQRNNGASVTVSDGNNYYCVDRWFGSGTAASGVFTLGRSASTPPTGYINFLRATVTTIDSSLASTDFYGISQRIEGFNISDLGLGTASASTLTLSFWVRSSLTGTFTGSLNASTASTASYVFSYTINAANTWEQKTIVVAGPTIGTFSTGNTIGLQVWFSLALGSTYSGTANTWTASGIYGATGATNFMATNGATFDITGVQLERGSNATSFEFRDYGRELIMCQRYFAKTFPQTVAVAQNTGDFNGLYALSQATSVAFNVIWKLPVTMRAQPTATTYSPNAATANWSANPSAPTASVATISQELISISGSAVTNAGNGYLLHASASAEL